VQTNKTKESVVEFVNELKSLSGAKPITDQELMTAKHARIRGYAQQFEAVGRIADQVAGLWVARLPMTELQKEPTELERATLSSVNAVAQKYSAPAGVSLLLVGDLAKIEAGVRELNLGEIIILDNEGKLVTRK
jgi:zinc protease